MLYLRGQSLLSLPKISLVPTFFFLHCHSNLNSNCTNVLILIDVPGSTFCLLIILHWQTYQAADKWITNYIIKIFQWFPTTYKQKPRYKFDPWTTWIWTTQASLTHRFFFSNKHYSITRSAVDLICRYGTADMEGWLCYM